MCCRHVLEQVVLGKDSQATARVWTCTELPSPFQKTLGPKEQAAKVHSPRVTVLLGPGAEPGNGAPAPPCTISGCSAFPLQSWLTTAQ